VSQEQRDREQPWVLAGGQAGHRTDEHVEVVADVEFFEQCVQQPARQREAGCAFGQRPNVVKAPVSSPVIDLDPLAHPGRQRWARRSPAWGSDAHDRHLRLHA
jgi:hypothetical protein